jgi:hypothetical protein
LSKIQQNYPLKGQNNDSQGFRDNFHNIYGAIAAVNTQVENLDNYTIKTSGTGTFYGNTIKDVNLENTSNTLYEYELQTTDIDVDYTLGNYQVMTVTPGLHNLSVSNWPALGKSGHLTLAITPSDIVYTAVNFSPDKFRSLETTASTVTLYDLFPGTNLFELWSEEGLTHRDSLYYVKQVGRTASTSTNWNKIGTNTYSTSTRGENVISGNNKFGTIGLVHNVNTATVSSVSHVNVNTTTITLSSVAGIAAGAKFYAKNKDTSTTSSYTVTSVTTVSNTISTQASADPAGGSVLYFTNPRFDQPAVLNLIATNPTTATSSANEIKGQVYADSSTVYVVYADADFSTSNVVNKVQISGDFSGNPRWLGTATTATTSLLAGSTASTVVATNQFVWNVINDSTTTVAYAYTATYVMTATTAITATYATTATSMIPGANGFGTRTVSYSAPSGGVDGDIWYQII